jgi:tetratricopeptide (TPR) repeat protein
LDIVSEEVQKEKFEEQMSNVKAQIKLIEKAVKAGKTDFAVKNYIEAASLFKQLPEGFLKEKNPVQEKLLDLYSQINEMVLKEKVKRFSYDFNKIKELLEEANKLIDANKLKEAQDYYERILKLYDKLPAGFLERKTMLRLNILNLYDKIRDKYNDMNKNLLSSLKLLPSEESEK